MTKLAARRVICAAEADARRRIAAQSPRVQCAVLFSLSRGLRSDGIATGRRTQEDVSEVS